MKSILVLIAYCDFHLSFASSDTPSCLLVANCKASQKTIFNTTALSTQETTLTCRNDASITDWEFSTDSSTRPILETDTQFTAVDARQLKIKSCNITGEFEAKYYCRNEGGGLALVGCLVVQGRAFFETCNGSSEDDGCSAVDNIVATNNQQVRLDLRVVFKDGGICDNETIRRLEVEHGGALIYNCPNILDNQSQPCFPTDKYHVDNSQCPQDCEDSISQLQCCKFRFFLTIMNFSESDTGRYVATVTLEDRRQMRKMFDVSLDIATVSITSMLTLPIPTATLLLTSTIPTTTALSTLPTTAAPTDNNSTRIGIVTGICIVVIVIILVAAIAVGAVLFHNRSCKQSETVELRYSDEILMTSELQKAPDDAISILTLTDIELTERLNSIATTV